MRIVFGLVLLLGIALAGGAVYMARGLVAEQNQRLAAAEAAKNQIVPTSEVFVLKRSMRYGERLRPDDVRKVRWPTDAVPAGAFTDEAKLFGDDPEELRSILRAMEKDEAVLAVKVTAPGEDAGVGSRLSAGMRALAIRVDVTSGVSGFLRPGDRVDVYWTGRSPSGDGEITRLIDTSVRIIAIDQIADEDRNSPLVARTVTVEATPQQVASLAQAQETGRLTLSLVGAEDEGVATAVQVDQDLLLGIERRTVQQQQVCTIRTRKGAEIVEVPIECTN